MHCDDDDDGDVYHRSDPFRSDIRSTTHSSLHDARWDVDRTSLDPNKVRVGMYIEKRVFLKSATRVVHKLPQVVHEPCMRFL